MKKFWYGLVLLLLLMPIQLATPKAAGESSSNYNSMLYPSNPSDIWVVVSQVIQGTSNLTGPAEGCPSGVYNWSYQANLQQDSELGNSWIQEVIEVSQGGNSCYTVEFYPDAISKPISFYYDAFSIPSNLLYEASSDVNFWMSYSGSNPSTVTAFYVSACCVSGRNTITWVIYPSQLYNFSNHVQLNSPVQFDFNSHEDFNVVAAVSGSGRPVGGFGRGVATFTSGSGQINYCSYNNAGLVGDQTAEESNMLYSSLYQSTCGSDNSNYFYQSFNPGTTPPPSLAIQTIDQSGASITGYYVGLYNSAGTLTNSGFSPITFTDLNVGAGYYVEPENYGSCAFSYWQDTGNTTRDRYLIAYGTQSLTAVYDCFSTGSVTVQTVNQNGQTITGYYVGLYNDGGTLINHGFSPVTFSGLTIGTTYSVEPDNYGSCTFNHWQDTGSIVRNRAFTAASTQTFTAVYDCT